MRITELRNVTLGLKHNAAANGVLEHWELSFTDKMTADITWVALTTDVAEQLVANLARSDIQIAKPKLVIPGNGR